jgi:ABC-type cobalt transport system substrate-binding protein
MMSVDDDTQYEGTEYGGADKINKEQIQEILENIKYRKANRLK